MTRLEIEKNLYELNRLITEGKMMEALDKYYHDDVVMQENEQAPIITKEANRKQELEFLDNIIEFRSALIEGIGVGEGISYVIWKYDYTHWQWGVRKYTQVSVQEWKDGKIIREKFVYPNRFKKNL